VIAGQDALEDLGVAASRTAKASRLDPCPALTAWTDLSPHACHLVAVWGGAVSAVCTIVSAFTGFKAGVTYHKEITR